MKYRIFCQTEGKFIENESLLLKEECPNDPNHIIQSGSLSVLVNDDNLTVQNGCMKDYRKQRHDLIDYVTNNFSSMSSEELKIASYHFATPKEVRDLFYSMGEQIINGIDFNKRATESRQHRFDICLSKFFNRYTYEQTTEIASTLTEDSLIFNYINIGIEGTTEGDPFGIFDYVESTSGTKFENNGLAQELFTPSGVETEEFIRRLMHILRDGCLELSCSGNCGC